VFELDRILDGVLGCLDPDLIVFAPQQLHEDINGLGDIALDAGNSMAERFVLGLLSAALKTGCLSHL
jgi:hypothetical protein